MTERLVGMWFHFDLVQRVWSPGLAGFQAVLVEEEVVLVEEEGVAAVVQEASPSWEGTSWGVVGLRGDEQFDKLLNATFSKKKFTNIKFSV